MCYNIEECGAEPSRVRTKMVSIFKQKGQKDLDILSYII